MLHFYECDGDGDFLNRKTNCLGTHSGTTKWTFYQCYSCLVQTDTSARFPSALRKFVTAYVLTRDLFRSTFFIQKRKKRKTKWQKVKNSRVRFVIDCDYQICRTRPGRVHKLKCRICFNIIFLIFPPRFSSNYFGYWTFSFSYWPFLTTFDFSHLLSSAIDVTPL